MVLARHFAEDVITCCSKTSIFALLIAVCLEEGSHHADFRALFIPRTWIHLRPDQLHCPSHTICNLTRMTCWWKHQQQSITKYCMRREPSPREVQIMRASFDQRRVHDFSNLRLEKLLQHSKQVLLSSFIKETSHQRNANSLVKRALQRLLEFISNHFDRTTSLELQVELQVEL